MCWFVFIKAGKILYEQRIIKISQAKSTKLEKNKPTTTTATRYHTHTHSRTRIQIQPELEQESELSQCDGFEWIFGIFPKGKGWSWPPSFTFKQCIYAIFFVFFYYRYPFFYYYCHTYIRWHAFGKKFEEIEQYFIYKFTVWNSFFWTDV